MTFFRVVIVFLLVSTFLYVYKSFVRYHFDLEILSLTYIGELIGLGLQLFFWSISAYITYLLTIKNNGLSTLKTIAFRVIIYAIVGMLIEFVFIVFAYLFIFPEFFPTSYPEFLQQEPDYFYEFISNFSSPFFHGCILVLLWTLVKDEKNQMADV